MDAPAAVEFLLTSCAHKLQHSQSLARPHLDCTGAALVGERAAQSSLGQRRHVRSIGPRREGDSGFAGGRKRKGGWGRRQVRLGGWGLLHAPTLFALQLTSLALERVCMCCCMMHISRILLWQHEQVRQEVGRVRRDRRPGGDRGPPNDRGGRGPPPGQDGGGYGFDGHARRPVGEGAHRRRGVAGAEHLGLG